MRGEQSSEVGLINVDDLLVMAGDNTLHGFEAIVYSFCV